MATSSAILMTMIKLSEPKKPTTGFSPPDSETQAAIGRYKAIQNIGSRDPGVRNSTRLLNYVGGLTRNQLDRIDAHPNPDQRLANLTGMTEGMSMTPSTEFVEASGGFSFAPRPTFFGDLARNLGFDRGVAPSNVTLRDYARSQPASMSIANTADNIMGDLQSGMSRENINRRIAANNYVAALTGAGNTSPRVFFDRKNQLRNF